MSGWCLASINMYILTFPFRRMSCLPFKTKYATLTSPKATRHSMKAFFLNATKHHQQNCQKILWFQFQLFVLGKSYAKPGNKVIVTSGELERWKVIASPGFKLLVFLFMVMAIMIPHYYEGRWCYHEEKRFPAPVSLVEKLRSAIRLACLGGWDDIIIC